MNDFLNKRQNTFFVENTNIWITLLTITMVGPAMMAGTGFYLSNIPLLIAATMGWLTFNVGITFFIFLKGQATLRQLTEEREIRSMNNKGVTAIADIVTLMNGLEGGANLDEASLEMDEDWTDADDLLMGKCPDDAEANGPEPALESTPDPEPDTGLDTSDDN